MVSLGGSLSIFETVYAFSVVFPATSVTLKVYVPFEVATKVVEVVVTFVPSGLTIYRMPD